MQTNIKRRILDAERGKGAETVLRVRVNAFNKAMRQIHLFITASSELNYCNRHKKREFGCKTRHNSKHSTRVRAWRCNAVLR